MSFIKYGWHCFNYTNFEKKNLELYIFKEYYLIFVSVTSYSKICYFSHHTFRLWLPTATPQIQLTSNLLQQ